MIIDQIFRLLIGLEVPEEVEGIIMWYLPENLQVRKKKRMHEDLWLLKDHTSKRGCTSYWTFREEKEDEYFSNITSDYINLVIEKTENEKRVVYCDIYGTRNSQCIYLNDFITCKSDLYSGDYCSGYQQMLFNHDGESSNNFRFLKKTDEFIEVGRQRKFNKNVFLRKEIGNFSLYGVYGIDVLNIISKAIDGKYRVVHDVCGFEGDDTGDYENEIITIYNKPGSGLNDSNSEYLREFLKKKHREWLNHELFSGLVIGNNPELEYESPIETKDGEKFFSIYSKPNPEDITGGYWGYCRDKVVVEDGISKVMSGPSIARSWWNR